MPPAKSGKTLTPRADRTTQDLDRAGGRLREALGVRPAEAADRSGRPRPPPGAGTRSTRSSSRGWRRKGLPPSPEADSATLLRRAQPRPDRPAADDRGGRCLPRRRSARTPTRSRSTGCSLAPLTASAGAGIWLDAARYADSDGYEKDKLRQRLVLSRLGHQRLQPRPALRPVRHRADRRRPAAERDAGSGRRHRLPPQLDDQRGRRASTPSSSAWRRCSTAWTPSARASSA